MNVVLCAQTAKRLQGWQSGLMREPAKLVPERAREFESRSLRKQLFKVVSNVRGKPVLKKG